MFAAVGRGVFGSGVREVLRGGLRRSFASSGVDHSIVSATHFSAYLVVEFKDLVDVEHYEQSN